MKQLPQQLHKCNIKSLRTFGDNYGLKLIDSMHG